MNFYSFYLSVLLFVAMLNSNTYAQWNKALSFDGNNDYIDCGNNSSLDITNNITIEGWVKKSELGRVETILSKGPYSLKIGEDNKPYLEIVANSSSLSSLVTLGPGVAAEMNFLYCFAVWDGKLYAGISGPGKVFRYDGGTTWTDVGQLGSAYSVFSLVVFEGKLYGSTYAGGSKVYRYDGGTTWTDVGNFTTSYSQCLTVYNGKLYGGGYSAKIARYDGGTTWTQVGKVIAGAGYVFCLAVYEGSLYAGASDGNVYIYNGGISWTSVGRLGTLTNINCLTVYDGKLYGAGRDYKIYRYDGGTAWTDVGQLGNRSVVCAMAVYNGRLYAGATASQYLYRYEGGTTWTNLVSTGNMDLRALVVFDGKLYCGVSPYGPAPGVLSFGQGLAVYSNTSIGTDFSYISGTYDGSTAKIFVNGIETGNASGAIILGTGTFNLSIGKSTGSSKGGYSNNGEDNFYGVIDEVRLWNTSLSQNTIRDWMCKKVNSNHPNWLNLKGYWKFDEGSGTSAIDETGNNSGSLINDPERVLSGAPIGNVSAFDYTGTNPGDFSATLARSDGDNFVITGDGGTVTGLQVYRADVNPMCSGSIAPNLSWGMDCLCYWGAFMSGTAPSYSLTYNYNGHPNIFDEVDLGLAVRNNLLAAQWNDANATLNTVENILSLTGQNANQYALGSKTASNPLPVELTDFTAEPENGIVILSWKTITEKNNYGFEVERNQKSKVRSPNEISEWERIGFLQGTGTNNSVKEYLFKDVNIKESGEYKYRLKQIDIDGSFKYSNEVKIEVKITPKEFALFQNYPNPFNPSTNFEYQVSSFGMVVIKVYDVLGNDVATLANGKKEPGIYILNWTPKLSAGVYFYTMYVKPEDGSSDFSAVKKMLILK